MTNETNLLQYNVKTHNLVKRKKSQIEDVTLRCLISALAIWQMTLLIPDQTILSPTSVWEKISWFVTIFQIWCLCLMKSVTHQVFLIKLIIFFSHYSTFLKDRVLFPVKSLKAVLMHKKKVVPQFQLRAFACMTTLTRIGIKCRNGRQEMKMSLV